MIDASFLDEALAFASLETRHWVADALACHLHNTGYNLSGNTEANDIEWFARAIWQAESDTVPSGWERATAEVREHYHQIARVVLRVLPRFQERVAHRLIELSKVVRDIERASRQQRRAAKDESGVPAGEG